MSLSLLTLMLAITQALSSGTSPHTFSDYLVFIVSISTLYAYWLLAYQFKLCDLAPFMTAFSAPFVAWIYYLDVLLILSNFLLGVILYYAFLYPLTLVMLTIAIRLFECNLLWTNPYAQHLPSHRVVSFISEEVKGLWFQTRDRQTMIYLLTLLPLVIRLCKYLFNIQITK
jgi:hypothetical protein